MKTILGTLALYQIFLPLLGTGGGSGTLPTITFVTQSTPASQTCGSGSGTFTVTAPANGDTVILNSYQTTNSRTLSTVTMTGVTWTHVLRQQSAGLTAASDQFVGNVSAGAGTSITLTYSGALTQCTINLSEWSGIAASPLDGIPQGQEMVATTAATAAYSTGTANDLVMATVFLGAVSNITGFPSGYTQLTNPASGQENIVYQIVSGSGAQSATWNLNASLRADTTIIGFKP